MEALFKELSFAYGRPEETAHIKLFPEDFIVEEELGYELSGEGEHVYLYIEKQLLTTQELVQHIAKNLSLPQKLISYAGLKDKFGITRQWINLHLPGKAEPCLDPIENENCKILATHRHQKKLKIGNLKANHFRIRLRDLKAINEKFLARMNLVKTQGVPNYFGQQRFGNRGNNLYQAQQLLLNNKKVKNPYLKGIYYSAARAFLFNQIVSYRIDKQCWDKPIPGDLMMLAGTHSFFSAEEIDESILARTKAHDISPAAPLWGEGKESSTGEAFLLEQEALAEWKNWCEALEKNRLRKMFRPTILIPQDFQFQDEVISFTLPAGTFATSVLRELVCSEEITE